jgi:hypothetical protein
LFDASGVLSNSVEFLARGAGQKEKKFITIWISKQPWLGRDQRKENLLQDGWSPGECLTVALVGGLIWLGSYVGFITLMLPFSI